MITCYYTSYSDKITLDDFYLLALFELRYFFLQN